jgi:hypothetical protein
MVGVGRDAHAAQPPRQGEGEQQVGGLRRAERVEGGEAARALQVIEVQFACGRRADRDDGRRRAGLQPVKQQVGEQEGRQVVGGKHQLQPFAGHGSLLFEDGRVVDQDVQPIVPLTELCGQATHRGQRRQVPAQRADRGAAGLRLDLSHGGVARGLGARHNDDGRAALRQLHGDRLAQPSRSAGDQANLVLQTQCLTHVGLCCSFLERMFIPVERDKSATA